VLPPPLPPFPFSALFMGRCAAEQPEKWHTGGWFLYHKSAPIQSALFVQGFLVKYFMIVVPCPPSRSGTL